MASSYSMGAIYKTISFGSDFRISQCECIQHMTPWRHRLRQSHHADWRCLQLALSWRIHMTNVVRQVHALASHCRHRDTDPDRVDNTPARRKLPWHCALSKQQFRVFKPPIIISCVSPLTGYCRLPINRMAW